LSGSFQRSSEIVSIWLFFSSQHLSYGGRSSVGRALDCDSGGRGFKPRRSPHFFQKVTLYGGAFFYAHGTLQCDTWRQLYHSESQPLQPKWKTCRRLQQKAGAYERVGLSAMGKSLIGLW
jgi:hypothetical protein